ncbi:unnamed protein product [Arabidopsis halleri]
MMMKAKEKEAEAATAVWWDINRCPVPSDVDVRRVGPCIKRELEKLGYSGPLIITAIGILKDVPHDFLRQVYSSGIAIQHIPLDIFELSGAVLYWTWDILPPANIMLISNESIFSSLLETLCKLGYNVIRSIFPDDPQQAASASPSPGPFFLWESLLASLRADAMDSEALQEDKCSETGESALLCEQCSLAVQGFENFTTHLKSKEHAEQGRYYQNNKEQQKIGRRRRRRR